MQVYVIKSIYSGVVLAEIRTDGTKIDWVADNSNGKLAAISKGDFAILKNVVDKSHHLEMTPPDNKSLGILRYSLENGDIIEISTDGKTALLNGSIMSEAEKSGLMSAIGSGKIKIKTKAKLDSPIPLAERVNTKTKEKPNKVIAQGNKTIAEVFRKKAEEQKALESTYNRQRDGKIDAIDFSNSACPELGRQLLYLLKYGEDDA